MLPYRLIRRLLCPQLRFLILVFLEDLWVPFKFRRGFLQAMVPWMVALQHHCGQCLEYLLDFLP
jgi:hypothetical protein